MSQAVNTRMEQQVRNQARVLFWVSALLLVTCASMTGTFGWSLGRSFYEKVIYTMGFVVADSGGAGLMAVSGTCAANKATKAELGTSSRSGFALRIGVPGAWVIAWGSPGDAQRPLSPTWRQIDRATEG